MNTQSPLTVEALRNHLNFLLSKINSKIDYITEHELKEKIQEYSKKHNDKSDLQYELTFNAMWQFDKFLKSELS